MCPPLGLPVALRDGRCQAGLVVSPGLAAERKVSTDGSPELMGEAKVAPQGG